MMSFSLLWRSSDTNLWVGKALQPSRFKFKTLVKGNLVDPWCIGGNQLRQHLFDLIYEIMKYELLNLFHIIKGLCYRGKCSSSDRLSKLDSFSE